MSTLTKKIVLPVLVLLLSACAYYPNHYGSYPDNAPYYSGYGYSNDRHHQHHYPRQPAPGYWGRGRPYGGHHSNNYYQNNNDYNRPPPRPYPKPGFGYHDHRNYPPAGRGGYPGGRGHDHHRDNDNRPSNWGGWQGRNDQPRFRPQPMAGHHDDRPSPPARRDNRQNGGWLGEHRDHGNRPPNWGGWQGRNNQPRPRVQPLVGHHDDRPSSPPRRDNRQNGGWLGEHRDHGNRPSSGAARQGNIRNNERRGQPFLNR